MLGQQVVAAPDAVYATRTDGDAFEVEVLSDAQAALGRVLETMLEDGLLNLVWDQVRVRSLRFGHAVDQPIGAVGLVVAADLIELLAAVAGELAGLADAAEIVGEF